MTTMTHADELAFMIEMVHFSDASIPEWPTEDLLTFKKQVETYLQINRRLAKDRRTAAAVLLADLRDSEKIIEEYRQVLELVQQMLDERNI